MSLHDHAPRRAPTTEAEKHTREYLEEGQRVFLERYGNTIHLGAADKSHLNTYLREWQGAFAHGEPEIPLPLLTDNFVQMYYRDVEIPETVATEEEVQDLVDNYTSVFVSKQILETLRGNTRMDTHMVHQKLHLLNAYASAMEPGEEYDELAVSIMEKPRYQKQLVEAIHWIVEYNKWSARTLHNILYGAERKERAAKKEAE
jgi:hypothetical protein